MPVPIIKHVSLTPAASGVGVAGGAPNVLDFKAGTLQPDGTFVAAMHWDPLFTRLQIDTAGRAPATNVAASLAVNFGGVVMCVKSPNALAPLGFDWQTGRPIGLDAFTQAGGQFYFSDAVDLDIAVVPLSAETWSIIAASVNKDGAINKDSNGNPTGPSIDLTTLIPPLQPTGSDFSVSVLSYGRDDGNASGTLQNVGQIQVDISMRPASLKYFSIWSFEGAAPPSDLSKWVHNGKNISLATSGDTFYNAWFEDRSYAADRTFQVCVTASYSGATVAPIASTPTHSVTINQVALPSQPASLSVTLHTSPPDSGPGTINGNPSGALSASWPPPADLEYFSGNLYMIDTDAGGTPLGGAIWNLVGNAIGGFDQRALVPPQWFELTTQSYKKFKVQAVSRAFTAAGVRIENTTSPPTTGVLNIPASAGFDASKADGSTVGTGLESVGGKLRAKVGSTMDVDGSGNLIVKLGSIGSGNLAPGSLGDLSKYASDKRPIVILTGTPFLPDSNYPNGAIIFNTSDGKLYRNVFGTWSKGSDPQDLIAGTIASGVAYIGRVVVSQLDAGTATFSGDVTFQRSGGSSIVIGSAGITLQSSATSGKVVINNAGSSVSITDNAGRSTFINGNIILAGLVGAAQFDFPSGGTLTNSLLTLTLINGSGVFTGAGVSTPFYGHSAAGFNPYVSGQYYGATKDVRVGVTVAGTFYWCGFSPDNGASFYTYEQFKGGAFVGVA